MDLQIVYDLVEGIALGKVNVNSYFKTSPYIAWQSKSVQYSSVCFTIERAGTEDNVVVLHGILYYGDRLKQDGSNWVRIQTDATNILLDIISDLKENDNVLECELESDIEYWNQRLTDYCAGGYVNVSLTLPLDTCENYNE